jgi:integrase
MRKTITAALAIRLKPPTTTDRIEVFDSVIPSFGMRITQSGIRSWFLMTRLANGEQVRVTFGRLPAVTLVTARALARKALDLVARGEDPRAISAVDAARTPGTFAAVAREFLTRGAAQKSHAETRRVIEKELMPSWAAKSLRQITRRDIVQLLDGIVERGSPVMANRVLTTIKRMVAFALDRDVIDASPCARMKPPGGKERSRDRVLTDAELRGVWHACDPARLGIVRATFARVLMLTAQRRGEVARMGWADLDLAAGLWRLADTKSGAAHEVPLTPVVAALLREMPHQAGCPFVFSTNGRTPLTTDFSRLAAKLRTASATAGWTLHDLRRTAASGMTAVAVPPDHVERVLNHALPGMRAIYVRHSFLQEKRAALEAWAAHVARIVADTDQRGVA